jgi:hypothetical protein
MNIEPIHQPVGVLAEFAGGECKPVRFVWKRRTYEVDCINGRWIDRHGETPTLNFSVQVGEETYYLRFLTGQAQWWLEQVIVP